jgi:hypothetical protein
MTHRCISSSEDAEKQHTRRHLLRAAGAGAWFYLDSSAFAAQDFWNRKQSAAWTAEEVLQLTTASPWAKETRVDLKAKGQGAAANPIAPDPTNDPTTRNQATFGGAKQSTKPLTVMVTWESALPLFDAMHYRLPADFINHYVIGVKDLPILVDAGPLRESSEQLLDWLKNSATLRAKSKDPVEAGVVMPTRAGSMVLFGFLKELLPLSEKDKEVLFTLDTNQLAIKTRFDPRDMLYRGKLAL